MLTNQRTGDFAQLIDVLHGELIEALVGLLGTRLREDQGVQELVVVLLEVLVGELRVLRENVRGEVVVIVPAENQSAKPLRKPVDLAESSRIFRQRYKAL